MTMTTWMTGMVSMQPDKLHWSLDQIRWHNKQLKKCWWWETRSRWPIDHKKPNDRERNSAWIHEPWCMHDCSFFFLIICMHVCWWARIYTQCNMCSKTSRDVAEKSFARRLLRPSPIRRPKPKMGSERSKISLQQTTYTGDLFWVVWETQPKYKNTFAERILFWVLLLEKMSNMYWTFYL